jgi:hypothetical protein
MDLQSKRWADHGEDSEDEAILLESITTPLPPVLQDNPPTINDTPYQLSASGKIVLGSSGTRASAARAKRDVHATRLVVGNLEAEISEQQISRFLCTPDVSIRILRQRGLAFVDVRGAPGLVDRLLALDGTRLGRRVVSVRLDGPPSSRPLRRPPSAAAGPEEERWAFVETASEAAVPPVRPKPHRAQPPQTAEERKPLQLLPRSVESKDESGAVGADSAALAETAAAEAVQQKREAKVAASRRQTGNRFAGLLSSSEEEEEEEHLQVSLVV